MFKADHEPIALPRADSKDKIMTAEAPKRVGRRSKGDRKLIGFRLATDKADAVSEIAAAEGYRYVSDWVASVVAERIEKTDMREIHQHQGEFPISRTA